MIYYNIFMWAIIGILALSKPITPTLFTVTWIGIIILYFKCLSYEKLSTKRIDKDKKRV